MRFALTINFVLLAACLAQDHLESKDRLVKLIARADTSSGGSPASSGTGEGPKLGPNIKDPKVCAAIVKSMKDAEALAKGGSDPPKGAPAASPSASKSSGASRRSQVTQSPETDDSPSPSGDACKEMQAMIQAKGEKLAAGLKGMAAGGQTPKKDSPSTDSKAASPQ